jgi:hypothetical protein
LPTADELVQAPELAILGALQTALDLAIVALVAAQPELQPSVDGRDAVRTTAAIRADELIASAQALAAAISGYQTARRYHLDEPPF